MSEQFLPTMEDLRAIRDSMPKQKRSNRYPSGVNILTTGETCKTCVNLCHVEGGNQQFYKCGLNRARWTNSYGTDLRLKDAACSAYEKYEGEDKKFCFWCGQRKSVCAGECQRKWEELIKKG